MWWNPGSLSRAVELLEQAPRVGVLSARVLVDEAGETDTTCRLMARSPLDATGLPGPSLVGYMAGSCAFRTSLYRQIGGYQPRLFIGGGEKTLPPPGLRTRVAPGPFRGPGDYAPSPPPRCQPL